MGRKTQGYRTSISLESPGPAAFLIELKAAVLHLRRLQEPSPERQPVVRQAHDARGQPADRREVRRSMPGPVPQVVLPHPEIALKQWTLMCNRLGSQCSARLGSSVPSAVRCAATRRFAISCRSFGHDWVQVLLAFRLAPRAQIDRVGFDATTGKLKDGKKHLE